MPPELSKYADLINSDPDYYKAFVRGQETKACYPAQSYRDSIRDRMGNLPNVDDAGRCWIFTHVAWCVGRLVLLEDKAKG